MNDLICRHEGHRLVRGDDPDDGVADLAAGMEGKPLFRRSIATWVGLIGRT
jgi:hypothetical protein